MELSVRARARRTLCQLLRTLCLEKIYVNSTYEKKYGTLYQSCKSVSLSVVSLRRRTDVRFLYLNHRPTKALYGGWGIRHGFNKLEGWNLVYRSNSSDTHITSDSYFICCKGLGELGSFSSSSQGAKHLSRT